MRMLRRKRRGRFSLRFKFLFALANLVFALIVAEVALRHFDHLLMRSETIYRKENLVPGRKILAVGDSFTHGGFVARNETYPHYLEQMIHEIVASSASGNHPDTPHYRVINAGVCAMNTREMWEYLPGWVETFQPAAVLLMVGSANWFNFHEYVHFQRSGFLPWLKRTVSRLRTYKALYFLYIELIVQDMHTAEEPPKAFRLSREGQPETTASDAYALALAKKKQLNRVHAAPPIETAWARYNTGEAEEALRLAAGGRQPDEEEAATLLRAHILFEAGKLQDADDELSAMWERNPASSALGQALAYYRRSIADHHRSRNRRYEAVEWYMRAIEADPLDPGLYSWLSYMHLFQSKHTAEEILDFLRQIRQARPETAAIEAFRQSATLFEQRREEDAYIEGVTMRDLNRAALLCRERGIPLVVLNYPISYPIVNSVLSSLAREHELPFVDNLSAFAPLEPREAYLFDDEHCTPKGHEVIAANVLRTLKAETLLP